MLLVLVRMNENRMKTFDNFLGLRYHTVRAPLLEVRASCFQGAIFLFQTDYGNPPLDKFPATTWLLK